MLEKLSQIKLPTFNAWQLLNQYHTIFSTATVRCDSNAVDSELPSTKAESSYFYPFFKYLGNRASFIYYNLCGSNLGTWQDYWLSMEFFRNPIPRKRLVSTTIKVILKKPMSSKILFVKGNFSEAKLARVEFRFSFGNRH